MRQPLQINFRDIPHSDAIEARVREKADKLDKFYDRIMTCSVMIEAPHGHHHKGNLYHIRIDLTVPNGEIVINRDPGDHHAHEDVYVAIRDAFDAARRKLVDGREIYFHRNSIVDGYFDALKTGDKVRFAEETGDRGLQAGTVHLTGKHNIIA